MSVKHLIWIKRKKKNLQNMQNIFQFLNYFICLYKVTIETIIEVHNFFIDVCFFRIFLKDFKCDNEKNSEHILIYCLKKI